jgi:hypothetical protein
MRVRSLRKIIFRFLTVGNLVVPLRMEAVWPWPQSEALHVVVGKVKVIMRRFLSPLLWTTIPNTTESG